MEAIWRKQYSLAELVAADKFKTYEELEKRMNMVLGKKTARKIFVSKKIAMNLSVLQLLLLRNQLWMNLSSLIVRARLLMPQSMKNELDSLSEGRDFNSPDITPSSDDDDTCLISRNLLRDEMDL